MWFLIGALGGFLICFYMWWHGEDLTSLDLVLFLFITVCGVLGLIAVIILGINELMKKKIPIIKGRTIPPRAKYPPRR